MNRLIGGLCLLVFTVVSPALGQAVEDQAADIVIADFEGADFGDWTVTGDAFGKAPATASQAKEHFVSDFKGKGLAGSFVFHDRLYGTLTSPPFKIERDYINLLIGGGIHGETCLQLLVGNKVVSTQSGKWNAAMTACFFDVAKYKGTAATLRVVDRHEGIYGGSMGHVTVDQIVMSDRKPKEPDYLDYQSREMMLTKKYIVVPLKNANKEVGLELQVDGQTVRRFGVPMATSNEIISFWAFIDITEFKGKKGTLGVNGAAAESFKMLVQADEIPATDDLYNEVLRPQFHFSPMVAYNNDANGMVYYDCEWHLYFQHNPLGFNMGNQCWGHAVSTDLVHWKQLPIAIYNTKGLAFSGSAVVDEKNTAGWNQGIEKTIVAAWTSIGRGECIAYSNDRGRTYTEFEGNPVIEHHGRDPKLIWYEPGRHWVLAVYDTGDTPNDAAAGIAFYTSNDMKQWTRQSKLDGFFECIELFQLPVDGDRRRKKWIIYGGSAEYAIGDFDGKKFTPEHEGKHKIHHGLFYGSSD